MQPLRLRKSRLLYVSIVLASALIIATVVAKPPVNYGVIFRRSADASRSVSTTNGNDNNNLAKSAVVVRTNRTCYININTKSKNQIANLENNINSDNNSNIGGILNKNINIALVAPTFTAAAYDHNSFYSFYKLYASTSSFLLKFYSQFTLYYSDFLTFSQHENLIILAHIKNGQLNKLVNISLKGNVAHVCKQRSLCNMLFENHFCSIGLELQSELYIVP
jgi:hypothetical protein